MFSEHDISAASTRSSEVLPDHLPDFGTYRLGPVRNPPRHIDPPRSHPADMAAPTPLFEQPVATGAPAQPGQHDLEAQTPTPDANGTENRQFQGVPLVGATPLRQSSMARSRKPSNASHMEGSQFPRLEFDFGDDNMSSAPPPQRNPSRQQMMRWGPPPPSEYDDYDRPYYPRPPNDYGRPMRTNTMRSGRTTGGDYLGEDSEYYNRPYRRMGSLRESDEWRSQVGGGGGGRGPPSRRGHPYSEYDEDPDDDERPLRRRRRPPPSEASPPPEIIYRLPFTEWMNKSVKARKYI